MSGLMMSALMAAALVQQSDTMIAVAGATRLQVESAGGTVTIVAWDRPEVRVQAEHSSRTRVEVDHRGETIDIEAEARRGPATIVDYTIRAPATLDVEVDGFYTDIRIEGMDGSVEAESLQGDIHVLGGRGTISVQSVQGEVVVEDVEGRIEVETVARSARISNASGEVYVEGVGGGITLENISARVVEAGTVGGRIVFEGTLVADGHYFFGSHGGSVTLRVPRRADASFNLATITGSISSELPGSPQQFERGRRFTFDVGNGSALVEVETFSGPIRILAR